MLLNLYNIAACEMSLLSVLREYSGLIVGGALVYRVGFTSMAAVTSCDIPLPIFWNRVEHSL